MYIAIYRFFSGAQQQNVRNRIGGVMVSLVA